MDCRGEWEKIPGFEFKEILYERKLFDNGYASRITINRPQRMNSVTTSVCVEMIDAFCHSSREQEIGVIVLTGAGDRAFCAGGDVESERAGGNVAIEMRDHGIKVDHHIWSCRKPIIAAVKGYCIGGGNHFAYLCDFTIAADNAIFGQTGARISSPADGYVVSYLTRVIGAKKAREVWFLCRQYTAQEALHMGLVNKIVPLDKVDKEVDKWCEEILDKSPSVIQIMRRSFGSDIDHLIYSSGFIADEMYPDFIGSEEQIEGAKAFLEKRKPNFGKFRLRKGSKVRSL